MATEELTIKINYEDSNAGRRLERIAAGVERLNTAADGPGLRNITIISETFKKLGDSASNITKIGPAFTELSRSADGLLQTFKNFKLSKYTAGINDMKTALEQAGEAFSTFNQKAGGVSRVANGLSKLPKALGGLSTRSFHDNISNAAIAMDHLSRAIGDASKKGNSINNLRLGLQKMPLALSGFSNASVAEMIDPDGPITGVAKVMTVLSQAFSQLDTKGFSAVSRLAEGLTKLINIGGSDKSVERLFRTSQYIVDFARAVSENISDEMISKLERLGNAMSQLGSVKGIRLSSLTKKASLDDTDGAGKKQSFLENLRSAAKLTTVSFSGLVSKMKVVVSLATKISKLPFKMILAPIANIGKGLQNMTGKFTKFLRRVGNVALYRAVRAGIKMVTSAVKDGVNHLYEWSTIVGNSFQKTMDTIATAAAYATNSIGAAVSPILDAVAPFVDALVDKFVLAINAFNQFVAVMTGATSWRRAEKVASSYGDAIGLTGKNADDTNDKVKELKRTLLGFDEINKLDDNSDSGSGNGSSSSGGSDSGVTALTFSEQPISDSIKDFADKFNKAWANADFTEIGTMLGEKIGGALLNVPWEEKIQPTTVKVAKSFGTLLNGMFDYTGSGGKKMWDGIAYTVYSALNTAILGYVTFFNTVNWNGIGQGAGDALKKVMQNLNWEWMSDALAAFPNAVIDALTGFCKQMTVADFYEAGQHIGETVSGALRKINWTGLFGNAFSIATRLLGALNGALEGFDWDGVTNGILKGIKSVSPEVWDELGASIGRTIFNIAGFVGNMVNVLIKAVEAGHWSRLIGGIWKGINDKVTSAYGGWTGAAIALGGWIVKHLGSISIALSLLISTVVIEGYATAIKTMIKNAIAAKIGTAATGGLTGAGWVGSSLKLAVAASLLFEIGMLHTEIKEQDWESFAKRLCGGIVGAVGAGFITGGPVGAALGFTVGAELTINFTKIIPKVIGGADNLLFGWLDKLIGNDRSDTKHGLDEDYYASLDALNGNTTSKQDRTYGSGLKQENGKTYWSGTVYLKTEADTSNSQTWWDKVSQAWNKLVSGKTVKEFFTKGVAQKVKEWRSQLDTGWLSVIRNDVSEFRTKGLQGEPTKYRSQLVGFWSSVVSGDVQTFRTAGVKQEPSVWRGQLNQGWASAIENLKLNAPVEIGNTLNASIAGFNALQTYFNDHHITAVVEAKVSGVQTALAALSSASSGSTYTQSSSDKALNLGSISNKSGDKVAKALNNAKNKKKADGGIYKDGQWHSISQYAVGGLPNSGQMFIAREAGPELVGQIGSSTAVLNNDQIVGSVAAGVKQAVYEALGGAGQTNEIIVKVDSEALYRMVKKGERKASGRYSTTVAVG